LPGVPKLATLLAIVLMIFQTLVVAAGTAVRYRHSILRPVRLASGAARMDKRA